MVTSSKLIILALCCLILILSIVEYHFISLVLPRETITITETVTITRTHFKVKYFKPFTSKLTLTLTGNSSKLGELIVWFNITRHSRDEVNATLTLTFYGVEYVKSVGLHIELSLIPFDGAYPLCPMPVPYVKTVFLSCGDHVTLFNRVYNMSKYVIPGFYIAYSIQSIQLTLKNDRTILYTHFYNGTCDVYEGTTLSQLRGFSGGIHPLWEGEYKYPPTMVYMELLQLSGVHMNTKVELNLDKGTYSSTLEKTITYP